MKCILENFFPLDELVVDYSIFPLDELVGDYSIFNGYGL